MKANQVLKEALWLMLAMLLVLVMHAFKNA